MKGLGRFQLKKHTGGDACGTRAGKEKTGLVNQGMVEEAGEFRMSTT